MNRRVQFWAVFFLAIALDQAVKAWARAAFAEHQSPGFPWPNVFELTLQYNTGIAFGMLPGFGAFLAPVAILIALGSWLYSHSHPEENGWTHTAMALLAGGALGNLIDRIAIGKVTDMFSFRAIDFPVFNVADSCITVAATILILRWGSELAHHKPPAAAGPSADSGSGQAPTIETASTEGK